ncbi:MAG: helix-turn-helix transcriptional regulator [Armatimonadota bacterium]
MNRVDRLLGYLLLLQSRGQVRAADFARRFEISERTVYRDIQALSEVGVPIVALPGKGYRLMEGYYLPPVAFKPDEAKALALALGMMTGAAVPGATRDAALAALEKIRVVLPSETLRQVEALLAVTRFYSHPAMQLDLGDRKLVDLQRAILDRRVVTMRYHAHATNEVTVRDVEPLQLVLVDRIWILDAYCRLRQAPRGFRLNRVDAYEVLEERFTPRELPASERRPDTLRAVVRFSPDIVRWVQERQHFSYSSQETAEESARGSSDETMIYRPRAFDVIDGWLLSWGDAFEVLEPLELRQHLEAVAGRIGARHGPAGDSSPRQDEEEPSRMPHLVGTDL